MAKDVDLEIEVPLPEAFLEEAKNEKRRQLLADHSQTITFLRDEKRFSFREIAEWLTKRGLDVNRGGVYRAYIAARPMTEEEFFESQQQDEENPEDDIPE